MAPKVSPVAAVRRKVDPKWQAGSLGHLDAMETNSSTNLSQILNKNFLLFYFIFIYSPTPPAHHLFISPHLHSTPLVNHSSSHLIKLAFYSLALLFPISSISPLSHQPFYHHNLTHFLLGVFPQLFLPSLHHIYNFILLSLIFFFFFLFQIHTNQISNFSWN